MTPDAGPKKIVYAGIDGTGPDNDNDYSEAFKNSFVRLLSLLLPRDRSDSFYERGPTLLGNETGILGSDVKDFVWSYRDELDDKTVVLSGYSRGGAAVIDAAQKLHNLNTDRVARGKKPVNVDYLVLFDAVDRSIKVDATIIPPNVKNVIHAMRSKHANSRPYFGNCGLSYHPSYTKYTHSTFYCTHGGVGGTPWWNQPDRDPAAKMTDTIVEAKIGAWIFTYEVKTNVTYQQDLVGSAKVWHWMSGQLNGAGLL